MRWILMPAETPSRDPLDLSVVIPAWDEQENLRVLLPAVARVLRAMGIAFEIVVVEGGSRSETGELAAACGARVIRPEQRGYGVALRCGFANTSGDYVVTMDADLSHQPDFLQAFWARRHDADLLIASRYVRGGTDEMAPARRLLSKALNRIYGSMLSLPTADLSSGFRMYRRTVLDGLRLTARDFDVLEEILVRIQAEGWRILEVPFDYRARRSGRSHVRLLRFGWAWLRTLLRMWRLRNSTDAADYDFRAFDSRIWLQRYWQRTRQRIILDFLDQRDSVLDVGCGSSRIVVALPKAVGFDIAQRKLRWLRPRHDTLVRGEGRSLPFAGESFDAVLCSEVLEHVPDPLVMLRELDRVLRPGGTLILGTPDYGRWSWRALERLYGFVVPGGYARQHVSRFTHRALAARLDAFAYEVLECRYVGYCEMIFKARKSGARDADSARGPLRPSEPPPFADPRRAAAPAGWCSALRDEILRTINLPHYFHSAFSREQAHRYLRAKLSRDAFDAAVERLVREGDLLEKGRRLYAREVEGTPEERREGSRDLFLRHRRHLRLLSRLPGLRFMSLTGANAFESCRPQDDLDLFVVTARDRLWLTFIAMIVWSRSVGRRDLFCINYLVDEDHLRIRHPSYYTAVQLMSMLPLVDRGVAAPLIGANRWVFEYLPNAGPALSADPFYTLEASRPFAGAPRRQWPLTATANRRMYRAYARRLRRNYPDAFGKGIVVSEGIAKLHPIDYGDLYERIASEGDRAVARRGQEVPLADVARE
jgi:dolichol-phosphate mannosyltransferase